jgi:hypothetical protein
MKKNIYLLALLIPAYLLMSYSSGAPYGYTGSPGDYGATCTTCHSSDGASYSPYIQLSGIPTAGYVPGQTYNLQLSYSNASVNKSGFEACIENTSNQRQGSFSNLDNNTTTLQNNSYITHTSSGNTLTGWQFQWTAPATSQGNLKLYYAINLANGNGQSTGDYVVNGHFDIPEQSNAIHQLNENDIKIYPNPATDFIKVKNIKSIKNLQITDVKGSTYPVQIQNNQINISFLPSGIYFLHIQNEDVSIKKQFIKK